MGTQRSKYGEFGQTFHDENVIDAMFAANEVPHPALVHPARGRGFHYDAFNWDSGSWTQTVVSVGTGTSTIAPTDRKGGAIRVNTAANDNDGGQAQMIGENFLLDSTSRLYAEALVDITDDVTQSDAFFGAYITDTAIIASVPDDFVGWHKDDGDALWNLSIDKSGGGPTISTAQTAVIDTWQLLGIEFDGTTVTPWFNGVKMASLATTFVPDDVELTLSFGYLNGAATAQNEGMDVRYIRGVYINDVTS